jgi:DNA-binding transcriptional LysR family regulator
MRPQQRRGERTTTPQIELELVQMETAEQLESINASRIDLGLSRPLIGSHYLESVCVAREPMMLAIPRAHPLAANRRPALNMLDGEPFIMFSAQARYLHEKLARLLAEARITPPHRAADDAFTGHSVTGERWHRFGNRARRDPDRLLR